MGFQFIWPNRAAKKVSYYYWYIIFEYACINCQKIAITWLVSILKCTYIMYDFKSRWDSKVRGSCQSPMICANPQWFNTPKAEGSEFSRSTNNVFLNLWSGRMLYNQISIIVKYIHANVTESIIKKKQNGGYYNDI